MWGEEGGVGVVDGGNLGPDGVCFCGDLAILRLGLGWGVGQ